jgi:hypothetical protein
MRKIIAALVISAMWESEGRIRLAIAWSKLALTLSAQFTNEVNRQ